MKKKCCIFGMILIGILFCACAQNKINQSDEAEVQTVEKEVREQDMTYEQISMEEAKQLMVDEEGYIILDVRTDWEYENGHIPRAICIPNESIGMTEPESLPDKEQLILVYCRSGKRSKQAARKLAELGYTNVKEFGGIMDWNGGLEW